jgi:uncharacterized protein YqfA (UPF0365 family)
MEERIVKKELRAGVDGNGVPTNFVWICDRIVTFDDGSSGVFPAQISLTAAELSAHISASLQEQQANLEADRVDREATRAERDALAQERAAKQIELEGARAALVSAHAKVVAALGE